jgi:hypothetical protein
VITKSVKQTGSQRHPHAQQAHFSASKRNGIEYNSRRKSSRG